METQGLTPFDSMVSDSRLQMIKAAIPYLSNREQQFLSIYVKYIELNHTFRLVGNTDSNALSSCSVDEEHHTTADMLSAIKQYCSDKEKEMIDLLSNFMSAYQMYHAYQELMPQEKKETKKGPASPVPDAIKSMLTPEQQTMLGTCMKLFPSPN